MRGVCYWEVILKRLSHLWLNVLSTIHGMSAVWDVRYWEASLYKQPLYKQLAFGKLLNNVQGSITFYYAAIKEQKWSFSFVINVKLIWNRQCTKIQLSQKHYMEKFKITDHKHLNPASHCNSWRYRLLGQTTKKPLSNFEPRKPWKYKQLSGLSPEHSYL